MKKTLVILLVICCSTVAYATSVSVMINAPKIATASSFATASTDVSAILTTIYGEYPQLNAKGGVDYTTTALSASFQQGVTHSNGENERQRHPADECGGDDPKPNPPSPNTVPEPNALLLVGIGLAGLGIALRLRR